MDKRYDAAEKRFDRTSEFLTTNPVEGTAAKLEELKTVTGEINHHGQALETNDRQTRGETRRQRALREALWTEYMSVLGRIARRTPGAPGMDPELRLPRKRQDSKRTLKSALGMADAAQRHQEELLKQGLPADFLVKFREAIDALAALVPVRVETANRRKEAADALAELVKRGRAIVDVLDAIVTAKLQDKPELLATWKRVKRPIEPAAAPASPAAAPAAAGAPAAVPSAVVQAPVIAPEVRAA